MALHAWMQNGFLIKTSAGIICVGDDHPCGPCQPKWWCLRGPDLTGTGTDLDALQCVEKTRPQINDLKQQGYIVVSGPHNTEDECLAECSEDVITDCCEGDAIPSVLQVIFQNVSEGVGCWTDEGVSMTITYDNGLGYWTGTETLGDCGEVEVKMQCNTSNTFYFTWGCLGNGADEPSTGDSGITTSCEPFLLELPDWTGNGFGACTAPNITISELS